MKVLWVTNGILPEAMAKLTGNKELKGSGGWMQGLSEALCTSDNIELTAVGITPLVKKLEVVKGEHITYYAIPSLGDKKYHKAYEDTYRFIFQQEKPDVVHIHGTEYPHSFAAFRACGSEHTCVSIQGLVSAYYYYYYGLSLKEILTAATPSSIIRGSILAGYMDFKHRSQYELQMLKEAKHIIGRTSWDRSHTWAINPNVRYHYCGEVLREPFYDGSVWQYEHCDKHSIFLSQAMYPLKGLHMVLRAIPIVLHHFPDTKVRVAGSDIVRYNDSFYQQLRLKDWGVILRRQLRKHNLIDKVSFTGSLNAKQMKYEYLKSNVFICPSAIENSPNSLGEAQILGVPCIASYVGGIPDMMKGDETHLYRFEEVEMLAEKICQVFEAKDKQPQLDEVRVLALKRHDINEIVTRQIMIYKEVSGDTKIF